MAPPLNGHRLSALLALLALSALCAVHNMVIITARAAEVDPVATVRNVDGNVVISPGAEGGAVHMPRIVVEDPANQNNTLVIGVSDGAFNIATVGDNTRLLVDGVNVSDLHRRLQILEGLALPPPARTLYFKGDGIGVNGTTTAITGADLRARGGLLAFVDLVGATGKRDVLVTLTATFDANTLDGSPSADFAAIGCHVLFNLGSPRGGLTKRVVVDFRDAGANHIVTLVGMEKAQYICPGASPCSRRFGLYADIRGNCRLQSPITENHGMTFVATELA